ncbi:MAG: hypothetical protein IKR58_06520 [Lachnospiraceae bacterium]|nr:hypothetical protein [Lachnospiraceae bacterium]
MKSGVWKHKILIAVFAVCMLLCAGVMSRQALADTTDQNSGPLVLSTEKVKEKIYLIPGEIRLLSVTASYGAVYESSDPNIVTINGMGQMTGIKEGKTTVSKIEGGVKLIYTVQVRGTVDLIVFAGQSNMAGAGGNYSQAPTPASGTAYEYSCIAGDQRKILPVREPFGNGTNKAYLLNGHYVSGNGTLTSAFCIEYYKKTKVPIVAVAASWGGTSTQSWLKNGMLKQTNERLKKAKKFLKKNGIKIRHIYVIWYQGESDGQNHYSGATFISNMKKIQKSFKKNGVEKVFMIKIAQQVNKLGLMNEIQDAQEKLCKTDKNFIMATRLPATMDQNVDTWYYDVIHINQMGLNKIGKAAGATAGKYAKKHKS